MLTSSSTRGAHRFFISTGRLRNVHWQIQRAALTTFVSIHVPAHTHTHTSELDDNDTELGSLTVTYRLLGQTGLLLYALVPGLLLLWTC